MKQTSNTAFIPLADKCIFIFSFFFILAGCQKSTELNLAAETASVAKPPKLLKDFTQVNLVSNTEEYHPLRVDPNLVNGWGIAFSPGGVAWISAEGAGVSVIYRADGSQALAPVAIPSPGGTTGGHPTGMVFNATSDFKLPNGNPARFIFDGVDGVISGWNGGSEAIKKVDHSATAVFTGLAIGASGGANFLYAANFGNKTIDVFDKNYVQVMTMPFVDPELPADYSPFNIQNIGGKLYVMYAKLGDDGEEEVHPGNGYVDIYNTDGSLVKRFVSRGQLNAPWGVAEAPAGFFDSDTEMQHVILVGNFGDGHINAYNEAGQYLGQLRQHGNPIEIEGLWAISFAPVTATTVDPNRLFFAAGPEDETNGLFGYISK